MQREHHSGLSCSVYLIWPCDLPVNLETDNVLNESYILKKSSFNKNINIPSNESYEESIMNAADK